MEVLVNNKTTDDSALPAVGTGVIKKYKGRIEFCPEISTGGSATFTILYRKEDENKSLKQCAPITCTDNTSFFITLNSAEEINCYTTNVSGTVSLKVE